MLLLCFWLVWSGFLLFLFCLCFYACLRSFTDWCIAHRQQSREPKKNIATWELLAQFAVTFCVESRLPFGHAPAVCHQGTDNSAADAAAAKGIIMTSGMSHVISQYFLFMRRSHVYAEITHIPGPGHQNVTAYALSRFESLQMPLDADSQVAIDWAQLLCQDGIVVSQPAAKWPSTFRVRST